MSDIKRVDFGSGRGVFSVRDPTALSHAEMGVDVAAMKLASPFIFGPTVNAVTVADKMPARWEAMQYVTWER